jgi:hypothetical protein
MRPPPSVQYQTLLEPGLASLAGRKKNGMVADARTASATASQKL